MDGLNATMDGELAPATRRAGVTQWLESRPSKPLVAGSNPVSRSFVDIQEIHIHGEREIRKKQASRERGNNRTYRSWKDNAHSMHHESAGETQSEGEVPFI